MAKSKTGREKKAKEEKNNALPGRPLKFPELDKLKADIDAYFAWCNPHIEYRQKPLMVQDKKEPGGVRFIIVDEPYLTHQQPYTITELAVWLGTTRETLLDYEELAEKTPDQLPLNLRDKDPLILREYSYTIKKAKARVEGFVERLLVGGRGHPAGPIFNLKNNFRRWEDKTVVENPAEAKYHSDVEALRQQVAAGLKSVKPKRK